MELLLNLVTRSDRRSSIRGDRDGNGPLTQTIWRTARRTDAPVGGCSGRVNDQIGCVKLLEQVLRWWTFALSGGVGERVE